MSIHDYAKLFIGKSFILEKTPELKDFIAHKAYELSKNRRPDDKRTGKQIFWSTENMAAEILMHHVDPKFVKNPWNENFNFRDPKTYAWDVNYDDDTFELKRWPPGDDTTWFTYPPDALKTMFKHINLIDYVICPKLIRHKDIYEVGFHMIADAKSFRSYLSPSKYVHPVYKDRKSVYYHHFFAMNDGNCVYNNNIKYRS